MIFITVGAEKFPFDRLFKIIDREIERKELTKEVYGQIGHSKYIPKNFAYRQFIGFDQMINYISLSDIVISHAGVGSTLLCLNLGKIPIIFPRRREFNEHLDNHQLEFAIKISGIKKTLVALNEEELIDRVKNFEFFLKKKIQFSHESGPKSALIHHLNILLQEI